MLQDGSRVQTATMDVSIDKQVKNDEDDTEIQQMLQDASRVKTATMGDGNCFFHAISMQLVKISPKDTPERLRQDLANESMKFVDAMTKHTQIWQRNSFPTKNASEYHEHISKNGVWAFGFDINLMARILYMKFEVRLVIIDSRDGMHIVLHPSLKPSNSSEGWKFEDLMSKQKLLPHLVMNNDVVILLEDNIHFSACMTTKSY